MSSYSKGSRGLSVLPRVHCIFTASSISLSLGWRQPGHHYAIRAGRNLPDKEFRYLRTVIVTAAVYRGFDQELRLRWPHQLTFRHRAGVTPYTSTFVFAQCCVFNKQLQPAGIFDWFQLHPRGTSPTYQRAFSRSYGTILPSSFTRVLSSALVFSTWPPVSVWGTIWCYLMLRGFSWKQGICCFSTVVPRHHASALIFRICLENQPTRLNRDNRRPANIAFSVPPSQ